jgi:hypothetical protein
MNNRTPPTDSPPAPLSLLPDSPKKRSNIVPALITILCTMLITGGSAFGYVATCSYGTQQTDSNAAFLKSTFFGAVLFCLAVLWLFVEIVVVMFRGEKGS